MGAAMFFKIIISYTAIVWWCMDNLKIKSKSLRKRKNVGYSFLLITEFQTARHPFPISPIQTFIHFVPINSIVLFKTFRKLWLHC